jgi:glutathione S-transferase
LFYNRFSNAGEPDEDKVTELKTALNEKLDVYETILSNQPYLAGEVSERFTFELFVYCYMFRHLL